MSVLASERCLHRNISGSHWSSFHLPALLTADVQVGKVDSELLLRSQRGDLQHPSRGVDPLHTGPDTRDAL